MGQSPLCYANFPIQAGRHDEGNFQLCSCVPNEVPEGNQAHPEINYASESRGDLTFSHHRLFTPHFAYKFVQYYQVENKIGEGSYGNVYKALVRPVGPNGRPLTLPASDGADEPQAAAPRHVAVKTFMLHKKEDDTKDGKSKASRELAGRRASFEVERSILSDLEHPHIVKMYECFEERSMLYIVLELCRGGELYEHIVQKARAEGGGGLEEPRAKLFFRQMVSAVSYLHARRVVHRDIKTENFLVLGEANTPQASIIKLCDFGTAAQLTDKMPRPMDRIGTLSYTAPEIYANRGADTMADAWSLGVVLYVLLVGASPFRTAASEPREETMRRIQEGLFEKRRPAWQALSDKAQDLVQCLLVVEEAKRMPSHLICRHQWLDAGREVTPRGTPLKADMRSEAAYALKAIRQFASLDCVQQFLLVVCAQITSEAELVTGNTASMWYDIFFILDKNKDGCVDINEFVTGMRQLLCNSNPSDEHLEELALALDIDASGAIEWSEWVAAAVLGLQNLTEDQEPLSTAFRRLDRPSGDGNVGAADMLAALSCDTQMDKPVAGRRDQVLEILGWWAAVQRHPTAAARAGPMVAGAPVSLSLPDVRHALEQAAAVFKDDEAGRGKQSDRQRHPSAIGMRPRARALRGKRNHVQHLENQPPQSPPQSPPPQPPQSQQLQSLQPQTPEANKEVLVEQQRALPE
mmetsp:Transcript_16922/g.39411  ORF Transcript_16922/g.39411 Transcript_16922/m.39411 type:complete len:693 (-) Transcript_16922:188-2266(-)